MYIVPGQKQTTPWGQSRFINSIIQSILSFAASFPQLNDCSSFPHSFLKPFMGMGAILVM